MLHEEADDRLATAELPATGEIVLVVGPEGGITPTEVTTFTAAGARRSGSATASAHLHGRRGRPGGAQHPAPTLVTVLPWSTSTVTTRRGSSRLWAAATV